MKFAIQTKIEGEHISEVDAKRIVNNVYGINSIDKPFIMLFVRNKGFKLSDIITQYSINDKKTTIKLIYETSLINFIKIMFDCWKLCTKSFPKIKLFNERS